MKDWSIFIASIGKLRRSSSGESRAPKSSIAMADAALAEQPQLVDDAGGVVQQHVLVDLQGLARQVAAALHDTIFMR